MSVQTPTSFQANLIDTISLFRKKYPSFEEAYSTYIGQYGESSVRVHDPIKISDTIDPVVIVLGRTTPLFYRDSRRTLSGSLGSVEIENKGTYILGRRPSEDSKLVLWSQKAEVEIELYDSRVRIVPSRIHAAIFASGNDVLFTDLGSGSGSILAGETSKPEPFITLYAPPSVGVHRIPTVQKYAKPRPKQ
ncbi:MAG TPA: hypothetical protein VLV18_06730 [Terriglobales bacterium]|nr:hypothetical protein [Terriglobales bacterium]